MNHPIVVADRVATAGAVVALESSVLAQGLPSPANLESAEAQSLAVRKAGAEPAVVGVVEGRIVVGADEEQMRRLATGAHTWKATVRDLAFVAARRLDGATTVSATAFAAESVGIEVMATGGIGGVHPGGADISADLPQLARSHLTVVCCGPKHVVDVSATLEWLETNGVLVVGFRTDRLPGFLAKGSIAIEHTLSEVAEVAELVEIRRSLKAPGALLLVQDPPSEVAMDAEELRELAHAGKEAAAEAGAVGKARTPFELDWLARRTGGRSLAANLALLEANALLAGEVAVALAAR